MDDLLSVDIVDASDRAEVFVSGELDSTSRSTLETALSRVLNESDAETITLDLTELTFCDAAGLHAIAAVQQTAAAHSKTLVLANVGPAVALLFDAVQFADVVPIQTAGEPTLNDDPRAVVQSRARATRGR
jgi:anti-anti-sigma factor